MIRRIVTATPEMVSGMSLLRIKYVEEPDSLQLRLFNLWHGSRENPIRVIFKDFGPNYATA